MNADAILNAVHKVTKKWCKQRKAEERDKSRVRYRHKAMVCSNRVTQKDVAWDVMKEAYLKASGNGQLPAHARQIMYAARPAIQAQTGEPLDDKYFTQTLLPDFMNEHPRETAGWDVVFDARGHFAEPHTGREVPLGTLEVRGYLDGSPREVSVRVRGLFPTRGPANRFGGVLFIEKEGFLPLFRRVRLAERYDLAVMSTKGMSVTAARLLVDQVCGKHQVPLLVLHDFDKAGFSILGTLTRSNRRYAFQNKIDVTDLGLRLADVEEHGLDSEDVCAQRSWASNLRRNGASKAEVEFLMGGQRVELNAFMSQPFVSWIEGKLQGVGVRKVIPGDDVLAQAYRKAFVNRFVRNAIPGIVEEAKDKLQEIGIPADLRHLVENKLRDQPKIPWDIALAELTTGPASSPDKNANGGTP
jgi:hypothetical protein